MYKNAKKKIERDVAFPTCISVIHFSPLASDESVLEDGDMVKIRWLQLMTAKLLKVAAA
ncbi:hypothetical protein ARALYDRAFT_901625 [Arabidopsis lyrata subsp. lyrata]|uniref:Uncharacterized protein n=1 Tax=Arabidopsis lyrata subsp. lyrata TaxID=81972 RepID=D7LGV7_ARALL|nr:hypothetical protein ARALYDRAFT_901625 [Arabidopsis lyrata subsp. lyrata]